MIDPFWKFSYSKRVNHIGANFASAETLGFKTYPPAYLSPQASGNNLLIGANFASAASGYDENVAILNVSLEQENLNMAKEKACSVFCFVSGSKQSHCLSN